jgi:hypothetical protein
MLDASCIVSQTLASKEKSMTPEGHPSPDLLFDTLTAYQRSAALKAAVDLEIFTILAEAPATASAVAKRCGAAERGIRILCDYMTVAGFLKKAGDRYEVTADTAVFLNKNSPAYAGGSVAFLLSDDLTNAFRNLTASVRKGGTAEPKQGSTTPDHPMWRTFARAMGGIMAPAAAGLAELIPLPASSPARVLDIAAGHGVWGLAFAKKYPQAGMVALVWEGVL